MRLVDPAQWATSPLDKSPREQHEFFLINTEVFFYEKGKEEGVDIEIL